MPDGARRLPSRGLRRLARRASIGLCLLIPGQALAEPAGIVLDAVFAEPTTRYPHGVLGDDEEWGALRLTVSSGAQGAVREVTLRLPATRVFEDLAPRLADLDFDGAPEVVVVESDAAKGARLSIYGAGGLVAATPFIGRPFRWLAPLGAADLDGDGAVELAYIDRPHLAKTLRVWRYADATLTEIASAPGLTNHRIGEGFISGGIRACGQVPEIITTDAGWRNIVATRLEGGQLHSAVVGPFDGPQSFAAALTCEGTSSR
ncbi:MAG: VCBS repeat-containing protein [Rhodobacter sp.]|nr:VCBS repeat-containing protein [Rhodobacter sp.]